MKTLEMYQQELNDAAVKAAEYANDPEKSDELKKTAAQEMKAALNAYNKKAAEDAYHMWAEGENAVKTALITLYVPKAKTAKLSPNRDTGKMEAVVSESDRLKIDLHHMMETIGSEYFYDRQWYGAAQRMCFIVAGNLNKALESDTDFSKFLTEAGKAFQFAEDASFTSNNSCLKALQTVVDMITGVKDEKGDLVRTITVKKPHWVYIREALTKQGKKPGEIAMGNTAKIIELIVDVMHCVLTDKPMKLVG